MNTEYCFYMNRNILGYFQICISVPLNKWNFQKKTLSSVTCVLNYSLTQCVLEDGFKDSCILKML